MILLALALAAGAVTPGMSAPRVVYVKTTEYHIAIPDTLPAGETTFRVVNAGHELHHVVFVRLLGGHGVADLLAAMKSDDPPPRWAKVDGGPNAVSPGDTSLATTVPLRAGHYAVVCMIPGANEVPHAAMGMIGDLVVRPASYPAAAAAPSHGATISLFDYGYKSSAPITRATKEVLVRNDGTQPHELVLVRLLPGRTMADLAAWSKKMATPPPAEFLGGVGPIEPGESNSLALSLPPGHYAMLCFLADAKDRAPHIEHGMVREFTIQ
jgi:uncharacterized cupredoxin-like copper-binding protein